MGKWYLIQIICVTSFTISQSTAQVENHKWIYSWTNLHDNDLYEFWGASVIDFNTLPPSVYKNSDIRLDFKETYASICDENGDYLYYSNGQEIHGKNHQPILNGDTINYGPKWEIFQSVDEIGNRNSNGFRGPQEIGFIPQPLTDTILVLYHNDNEYFQLGDNFKYHLMQAKIVKQGSNNQVVVKDEILNDNLIVPGVITCCRHANGRDWWLLQFSGETLYTYLVSSKGVQLDHIQLLPFHLEHTTVGQSKFSPNGDYFGFHGVFVLNDEQGKSLMISGFDRCTGDLLNPQLDILPSFDNLLDNGLEFSPDGKLMYISTGTTIRQYDLEADEVFSSMQIVAENNLINTCSIDVGPGPHWFGQMQLAPDNQIYISLAAQCNDVHIIRHPNVRGSGCEVEQNAIILPTFVMGTIPNTNTYRLGPLDGSLSDTLGIDNNPVSRYWYEQDSLDFLSVQFWDVSFFRPEEWSWDFGDGNSSTLKHPDHIYSDIGTYEVCLTVRNENSSDQSCQTLYLGTSSTEEFSKPDFSLYPNPTAGLTRLMLHDYLPRAGVLRLYDLQGQLVLSQAVRTGASILDLTGLDLGTYVYELRDGNVLLGSGKVVRISLTGLTFKSDLSD